jgi:hypothetical protein
MKWQLAEGVSLKFALFWQVERKAFFRDYALPAGVGRLPWPASGPPAAVAAMTTAPSVAGGKEAAKKRAAAGPVSEPKRQKLRGDEHALRVHDEAPKGKIYVGNGGTCAYNVTLSQVNAVRVHCHRNNTFCPRP